jgi:hypothetical protein
MKREVFTGTKGKDILETADDITPVFLFIVVSASELKSPIALFHFLFDTMTPDQRMESEGRTVSMLEGVCGIIMSSDHSIGFDTGSPEAMKSGNDLLEF